MEYTSLLITHHTKCIAALPSFPSFEWDLFIIDSPKGGDLIFGNNLLYHFSPVTHWKNGQIVHDPSKKDSNGLTPYFGNASATSVNIFALVGELKTPPLPSSNHILPIIPSQSLLQSRDEVFKKMNDVVEDIAISSLN
ncbi:hypothetical protein O181_065446 [Austropuccinia psidii MF-1]|uniref:Uncharacterized protein n=1 Tax=Austropuccinia psidii MF-1 TaxID=1389203 RepID=A0A9Q3I182_9BASI|nr:hypothetical protein [Austropuccinia psidii MF-1]